jgi:signal peptidase I
VAVGGDEILYADKKMLIHFHEGDEYIKKNYPESKIVSLRGRLWVINPYMEKYPGIQYEPEGMNIFEGLLRYYSYNKEIDMTPVHVNGVDAPVYELGGKTINALYTKVDKDHFYMIGDNRDNSNDSRFWGAVPYRLIVGKPWLIYMSLEHRSYERVLEGDEFGGGRDHAGLKRVCGVIDIESEACKALWENQRFTVRWGRVGRRIDTIQHEQPIE